MDTLPARARRSSSPARSSRAGARCWASSSSAPGPVVEGRAAAVCVVLGLLVAAGELRPIVIARGDGRDEITVSTPFSLALLMVGPLWLADQRAGRRRRRCRTPATRKAGVKLLFNGAQYALTVLAARAVYAAARRPAAAARRLRSTCPTSCRRPWPPG